MRSKLQNNDFTFLSPNCIGGILLHDLGLRFLTPMINLMMTQKDFLLFVLHLDEYLQETLSFYTEPDEVCPCAHLICAGLPILTVYFTHYHSQEEAELKWRERASRINKDNIFVFIEERDGINEADLKELSKLSVRGIVAFTCNYYSELPYTVYVEKYHSAGQIGNILHKRIIDDSREYEKYFDFIKWFNEANGGDYNVEKFIIK